MNNYKLVAPDIDRLLNCFNGGFTNPAPPSQQVLTAMEPLFSVLADLAPLPRNHEAKSIWLRIPKGTIDDYDSYEDMLDWGEVKNRAE